MNKVAYQPLPVLVKAEPSDSPWISSSAKVLRTVVTFVTIIALFGAVAIFSIGFNSFTPGTFGPKGSAGVPLFPATNVSPAMPAEQDNGIVGAVVPEANTAHHGTISSDQTIVDQSPTPALSVISPPSSLAQPGSPVSASDSTVLEQERPEGPPKTVERELPKAVRKSLEKERREAERKRSRLEEKYQKHAISTEAYKKGEQKYKSEIERYRREMNAARGPKNESSF